LSLGSIRSADSQAIISATRKGKNLSVNNPMYGTVSPSARAVFVYDLNGIFLGVEQFTSHTAAAKWLVSLVKLFIVKLNTGLTP